MTAKMLKEMCSLLQHIKPIYNISSRGIHLTCVFYGQGRVMKKIVSGGTKKKHRYVDTPILPSAKSEFSAGAHEGKRSVNSRRVSVLNKLFMRHITDLMMTGENAASFIGHGIEINRVQITPDFQSVVVYWLARGTSRDDVVDKLLMKEAGGLRHELSNLRVMGVVPKIKFVKDKHYAQLMEVDIRLTQADFGDDFIRTEPASKLKSELQLHTALEPHIKDKIERLDDCEDEPEEYLPPMPQNVLGLNHADILDRVLKNMKKSQAQHRQNFDEHTYPNEGIQHIENADPVTFPSMKTRREMFKEFLARRELLRSKASKEMKNYRPELDYLEEEWEKKCKANEPNIDFDRFLDDTDLVDEDDNEKM